MEADGNNEIPKLIQTLINQQFYEGSDVISGRSKEVSVKISGSGRVINKLYTKMVSILPHFHHKDYFRYVKEFNKQILPIDVDGVYTRFRNAYDNAGAIEEPDPFLIASMIFSEILQNCREKIFNAFLDEMKNEIIMVKSFLLCKTPLIKESLQRLFSHNDKDISLTYNLVFLLKLAEVFDYKKVYVKVHKEISKRKKNIMKKIVNTL